MDPEALGLRWGFQTAINRGLTDVAFFTDAQGVVNYLNSDPWWFLLNPSSNTACISLILKNNYKDNIFFD